MKTKQHQLHLNRLTAACRYILQHRCFNTANSAKPAKTEAKRSATLQAFCVSALSLPGMLCQAQTPADVNAYANNTPSSPTTASIVDSSENWSDGDDEVTLQYGHYEEAKRDLWTLIHKDNGSISQNQLAKYPNNYNPISVDSEHAFTRFRLGERSRFAFNYSQDVWSGATPWLNAPAGVLMIPQIPDPQQKKLITIGATYTFGSKIGDGTFFNSQGQPLYIKSQNDNNPDQVTFANNRTQNILVYASPEVRNQADFKLGYDWDNASVDFGGGASTERDYLSRFGNLAARFDFNQKRTTLNMAGSYTNSDTHAYLTTGMDLPYSTNYDPSVKLTPVPIMTMQQGKKNIYSMDETLVTGNRVDGAFSLALSQVINKNAVASAGFAFTNSSGYLSNPYKAVAAYNIDTNWWNDGNSISGNSFTKNPSPGLQVPVGGEVAMEKRPHLRNQFSWDASYRHYVESFNAGAQLNYNFFHDDWGINAHTFSGEWRQPLFGSWTVTPHVRYYSQTAASFYTPYILHDISNAGKYSQNFAYLANMNYSSDQRLSAYGAISGGVSIAKQFARGLNFELGYEYYAHKGALTLDGTGTGDYADFQYFMASATLRANLGQLAQASNLADAPNFADWLSEQFNGESSKQQARQHHHHHPATPAGVMFAHMLEHAGDSMIGYRYMRSTQGDGYLYGSQPVTLHNSKLLNSGCPVTLTTTDTNHLIQNNCLMFATGMTMNMHMLDLMYAPTDWLNLMLMPQFVDMNMDMTMPVHMDMASMGGMYLANYRNWQASGGFGDTGGYALFKLWDNGNHHVHITQGISAPTGSVNQRQEFNLVNYYSYDMQMGSGTWDYKPSLTYTGHADDWSWGGQLSATHRLQAQNAYGFRYGDILQGTAWGGYQLTSWLNTTVRGVYTGQSHLTGSHQLYKDGVMFMPEDSPVNYGGDFVDVGFGLTGNLPFKPFIGHSFSFEWLQPVYTRVNGYQLDRTGALAATWNYAFN